MSNSSVSGFSIHDVLTRVVPGFVMILPGLIGLDFILSMSPAISNGSLLAVLLGSYIVGEVVEQFRTGLYRVPFSFSHFVYTKTDDVEKIRGFRRHIYRFQEGRSRFFQVYKRRGEASLTSRIELDFRESMESTLGVDFEKDRPREIYDALLIYLDSTLSNRTMRLQSLHVFAGNLKIVAVVSPILYGLISVYNWFEPIFTTMLFASIAASTFCLLFIAALSASEGLYLELLLKEYWLKQTGVTE